MSRALIVAGGFLALTLAALPGRSNAQNPRPFDDYTPRPTVSPYLNLVNNNNVNGTNTGSNLFMNYQLLVKPQLDQRKFNRQSSATLRQIQMQQHQQQASTARAQANAQTNQRLRPTGHVVTRASYSHYYPTLNRQQ